MLRKCLGWGAYWSQSTPMEVPFVVCHYCKLMTTSIGFFVRPRTVTTFLSGEGKCVQNASVSDFNS